MRRTIPQAVLAVVAEHAAHTERSHAILDNLLTYAGCPAGPEAGSMLAKAMARLRAANADLGINDPVQVIGKVVETYMDRPLQSWEIDYEGTTAFRQKFTALLADSGLQYLPGGTITSTLSAPTRTLQQFIAERNVAALDEEFRRAVSKAESEPREAVSAAANILESLCKHYIEEQRLPMPAKQVLGDLWGVVRKDLGFDPSQVADDDLRSVLTGLIQVVQGLAAFRTHASSAHGAGPKGYRLQPRHSRLAVHAAHTVTLFLLESWDRKRAAASLQWPPQPPFGG